MTGAGYVTEVERMRVVAAAWADMRADTIQWPSLMAEVERIARAHVELVLASMGLDR